MSEIEDRMTKSLDNFKKKAQGIRTGRANPELLAGIPVNYYGSMTPLSQLCSISTPESNLFVLNVFDASAVQGIEKAIQTSDLNLNPQAESTVIRIQLPDLTEERRKEFVKLIKSYAEEAKVTIRNIRRDEIDALKKQEKNNDITEDDLKNEQTTIQKTTDSFIASIDDVTEQKEKEIMKI